VPASWVAGDEVYGADPGLRGDLEARGTGYVLAVACRHTVTTGPGASCADTLAGRLPASAWQRRSAGRGAKATASSLTAGHGCSCRPVTSTRTAAARGCPTGRPRRSSRQRPGTCLAARGRCTSCGTRR
jgi:hypothetical protein